MEIVSGNLRFSINRGNMTQMRIISSNAVNDGLKHEINFIINETAFYISVDRATVIEFPGSVPAHLSGPLFVGSVEYWTPEVKDDLWSDRSFYGCFEV